MKLKRTIAILSTSPSNEEANELAASIALRDFEAYQYTHVVGQSLPDTLDDVTIEYLTKKKELAGEYACFFFVYPKE